MLTKSKEIAANVLKFLRITDASGVISLTNITMVIVMYKILKSDVNSMQDITALALGLSSYQIKRLIEGKNS